MAITKKARAVETMNDPRWMTLIARDPKVDGNFVYSVKTTGVYCRPGCPSRLAHPENITFHDTPTDAEQAGFRPCKRCQPDQRSLAEKQAGVIAKLCRFIEAADPMPTLEELAEQAGWSAYHLHRIFKAITGLTPKAYAAAHRAQRLRSELGQSDSVTQALYAAGYNSSSRFYEESNQRLGMTPKRYRAGGVNADIRFAVGECSLGAILVAQSERGVCAISLGDDPDALVRNLQDCFPSANLVGGDVEFEQLIAKVVGFIEIPSLGLNLPLDIRGTAFQQRVWAVLREIPPGKTLSYTEVAQRLGSPKAVRAVARACATNTLAVAIPCHRVIRNDGGLSDYRWGVERKRALLEWEAQT